MNRRNHHRNNHKSIRVASKGLRGMIYLASILIVLLAFFLLIFHGKTAVEAAEAPSTKCFTSICIENGDTLETIAQEHMDGHYANTEAYIKEIKQMNGLNIDSDQIIAGEYLTIPYYTSY